MVDGRGRVVVVGSLNLDHTVSVESLPTEGATVAGRGYTTAAGGKGLNQAVAAARQGAEVLMIGAVGDDPAGGLLAGVLVEEGIGTAGLRRVPGPSGMALITVAPGGANTIVVAPGANGTLRPADVEPVLLRGAAVVLCQLEVPRATVTAALEAGRRIGALTVLNPAPADGPLPAELLRLADLVVPNETEAAVLTGASSPAAAAEALREGGAATVVVTLGARGSLLVGAGGTLEVPAKRVRAVDSTAAGDAFLGALVAGLSAGEPVEAAAVRASAAGAIAATRPGAVPSLPSRRQVDELVAEDEAPRQGRGARAFTPGGPRSRPRSGGAPPAGPHRPRRPGGHGRASGGSPPTGG